MKCTICRKEIEEGNLKEGTSMYNSESAKLDAFDLPDDAKVCIVCAAKEIVALKREQVYGPIFETLSKRANSSLFNQENTDVEAMVQAFTSQHRYLQSEIFRSLIQFLEQLSELNESQYFDGRNEWIRGWAKKACDANK